jgi:TetR/AcrR family transcriptional repressor of nem operon
MRYGNEHKAATRARILARAGERFKNDGVAGSGVSALMADAGLTNGAFYTHFASKDALLTAVVAEQMRGEIERFAVHRGDEAELEAQMRLYLSDAHRDDRTHGCATAALVEDIARAPQETRQAYTEGLIRSLEGLASRFPATSPEDARVRALGVFSVLVGALQTARAVSDPVLSDAILEEGLHNALHVMRRGD